MRFLQHVIGANKLNLPFYLLKSIENMFVRARNHPSSSGSNMFHHGLIKLLITQELGKLERSWSHFLLWGGFKFNIKDAEKRKRKKVVENYDSIETKPLSENKYGDCYEQVGPEEITSAQLPEKELGWKNNENSNLGSVDKTQIVEDITLAQFPEEEIDCIRNYSPVLGSEMQTVKQGMFHAKKFSKQTEFAFKPFRPKTRPVNKLRMNMKALLNPMFNKGQVISV